MLTDLRMGGQCLQFSVGAEMASWEPLLAAVDAWPKHVQLQQLNIVFEDEDSYNETYIDIAGLKKWQQHSAAAAAARPTALARLAHVTKLEIKDSRRLHGRNADRSCVILSQLIQWCPALRVQHSVMCTGYTSTIAPQAVREEEEEEDEASPSVSQQFHANSGGTARLVCGQDVTCGDIRGLERFAFPGVSKTQVGFALDLLKHIPAGKRDGTVVIRDDGKQDPFQVLRTFINMFNSNAPYQYCGCLHYPYAMSVYQDAEWGGIALFSFDCESG